MGHVNKDCAQFTSEELTHICQVLADTGTGLIGSEIGYILGQMGVDDIDSSMTTWKRLFNALVNRQNQDQKGNKILSFVAKALAPARFVGKRDSYTKKLHEINVILAFKGLMFEEDGKFHITKKADNLTEAESRAAHLKENLLRRNLHPDLYVFCRAELVSDNYFHAVLEACKGIAETIRSRTGLKNDGATLIDDAFGGENPPIKINKYVSETERSEQRGFINLAKGLFGTFRNPVAHAPKIIWQMSEEDALDLFSLASYILRRIEKRVKE
jgi:uncharacterized protein (TIGR02391 family)